MNNNIFTEDNKLAELFKENEYSIQVLWEALPHCPEGQLIKPGHSTDAGFDIKLAEDVLIPPYESLSYKWEPLGLVSRFSKTLPNLFDASNHYIFLSQKGLRTSEVMGITYENTLERLKYIRKVEVRFPEVVANDICEGVLSFEKVKYFEVREVLPTYGKVPILERKVFNVPKLKTGIKLSSEGILWFGLLSRSSSSKFGVTQPHSLGVIDFEYNEELLLCITSLSNEFTVFKRGERIAQLVPMNHMDIHFTQVDSVGKSKRGGFGHTGG